MKYSYIIHDVDGARWCGGDEWDNEGGNDRAARFSTLVGASEALCRLAPGTSRSHFPLYLSKWRPAKKKKR